MNKHAYLIIAHEKFDQLIILLQMLDHDRNDIYLHIDKKVKKFPQKEISNCLVHSQLFWVERQEVSWGSFSQIKCELSLLSEAVHNNNYEYLHLLSGVDLPIKTQEYIHSFFSRNAGKEFIDIEGGHEEEYIDRCKYYWIFREKLGRKSEFKIEKIFYLLIEKLFLKIQKILGINRIPEDLTIKKGANWFSITGEFAKYVVQNKKYWSQIFEYSLCADELFIQTVAYNSKFINNIYENGNMRLIDWVRGNPYIFKEEDFEIIKDSSNLFARKFDNEIDNTIISLISKMNKIEVKE